MREEVKVMRIERVNESTIKFFITYQDIEKRGFNKDDLWMNRKRGEEFFWSLMDEVNDEHEEGFGMEGPLWIQVHAYDKGVEVIVSKSQNGDEQYTMKQPEPELVQDNIENFLDKAINESDDNNVNSDIPVSQEPIMAEFTDFEDLIKYTHEVDADETVYEDLLFVYNNKYYYQIFFDYRLNFEEIESIEAKLLEYASPTNLPNMIIEEYGKIIMSNNVRFQVRKFFKEK